MRLIDSLRHRRGFGVHSPLAFQGVKRVISPGRTDYYGYHDIDAELERNINEVSARLLYRWRADARFLLRFCVWMKPRSVQVEDNYNRLLLTALKAYDSRLKPMSGKDVLPDADLVVCDAGAVKNNLHIAEKIIGRDGGMAIVFNPEPDCARRLFAALPYGLMLHSRRWIVLLNRPGMQPISYFF